MKHCCKNTLIYRKTESIPDLSRIVWKFEGLDSRLLDGGAEIIIRRPRKKEVAQWSYFSLHILKGFSETNPVFRAITNPLPIEKVKVFLPLFCLDSYKFNQ